GPRGVPALGGARQPAGLRRQVGHPPRPDRHRQPGVRPDGQGDLRGPRVHRDLPQLGGQWCGRHRTGRQAGGCRPHAAGRECAVQGGAGRRRRPGLVRSAWGSTAVRDGTATYRVVQWATGNIGTRSLRGVIEHPDLSLAGLYVYSSDKAGRDAGQLCGLDPTGVLASRDLDEILGLGADCVLYMPRACDVDDVCRLLESGANVVTTRGEFHHPGSMDTDTRERVEAACRAGGTSIHSTGSSPGFISEAVPLVLSSIQRRLDHLAIEEFADLSQRPSPDLLFTLMG